MHILHLALGGCLKAAPVRYGVTEDTGGHIAYVLGAAMAQAALPQVASVDIVTRAFDGMDPIHAQAMEEVARGCRILRLSTANRAYLAKEALEAELPALAEAFCMMLGGMAQKPDVIHAHFADAARLARTAQKRFGIPWIYTPHSLALQKDPAAASRPDLRDRIAAERSAVEGAAAIIVSSRDEAERQLRPYGKAAEGRSHCVSPGVTLLPDTGTAAADALLAPFLRRPDRPIVLAVARPVAKKNLAGLVDAYAASPELQDRANLVILAGLREGIDGGPAEQAQVLRGLFDRIDRHGLWGKVALPPRHDAGQLRALYARAAQGGVFVNPALHEPFGLTLVEAAQVGVPVVATRNGGPVDIVAQLGHGALVDPGDAAQVAAACLRMMDDPQGAIRAQARALEAFDWRDWARRSVAICRNLQRAAPLPRRAVRRILASDIDGTLTGCPVAAARFVDWHAQRDDGLLFAVATGRSVSQARRVLADWALPRPDLFITSVGSEIWRWGAGDRLHPCADYAALLDADWDRDAVQAVLQARAPVWQAGYEQRRWKLSLLGTAAQAAGIERDLARAGLAARVIASHGEFIDVLPQAAGKAAALRFEATRRGLDLRHCIAAGDSGNDADMLAASGASILPSNAYAELAHLRGRGIYQSRYHHAAGVIDGLAQLGLARQAQHA
ncbi:HAD-IIB family hydrolase [Paracoccus haeundaensis]|uniref:sucrose-phosphate synthase n=1 Tax=Paracoccus haeundaensis TaxID=225362 RepID=A0A5C4R8N1_9RHOB|nr:HAD-IIB family hydrolase [Paracoccus haeundaensis]TNH40300.1 HAD-IIB family hydrolase [Paracoccus haeundaensis]